MRKMKVLQNLDKVNRVVAGQFNAQALQAKFTSNLNQHSNYRIPSADLYVHFLLYLCDKFEDKKSLCNNNVDKFDMILVFEVMYVGFRVCAEGVLEEKLKSLNEDGKEKCYIRNLEVTSGA